MSRRAAAGVAGLAALVVLAACAVGGSGGITTSWTAIPPPTGSGGNSSNPQRGTVAVVASTNVWGDIAARIGGRYVTVTSLVTDPAVDPRSFRPGTHEHAAVSAGSLIIENGGGYDDWMAALTASKSASAVINAVDVSGLNQQTDQPFNERVWFDLPTANRVGQAIADRLSALRPDRADYFQSTAAGFDADIHRLAARLSDIGHQYAGTPIALVDPVAEYLTEAAGLVDRAQPQLGAEITLGGDVPDSVLADTLMLINTHQAVAVIFNSQSTGPAIDQIVAAAADRDIPVAGVTETLPAGKDYPSWMDDTIANLAHAISA